MENGTKLSNCGNGVYCEESAACNPGAGATRVQTESLANKQQIFRARRCHDGSFCIEAHPGQAKDLPSADGCGEPFNQNALKLSVDDEARGQSSKPEAQDGYEYSMIHQCLAEAMGTFLLVVFGLGSVSAATFGNGNTQAGIWQVAVVWAWGVAISIYSTASISGAHLNPAVSLAFAITRPSSFGRIKLLPFWGSQLLGAVLAGCFNLLMFHPMIKRFEEKNGIVRGSPESVISASAFGEYFPNPGVFPGEDFITPGYAFLLEAWGTCVLTFVIFALTHSHQDAVGPYKELVPLIIGFTVAVLISLYAPMTQAGWNPARDFGPRIVAACAGWGKIAIPGPRNGFWVYIAGPLVGAPLGGAFHDYVFIKLFLKKHRE